MNDSVSEYDGEVFGIMFGLLLNGFVELFERHFTDFPDSETFGFCLKSQVRSDLI